MAKLGKTLMKVSRNESRNDRELSHAQSVLRGIRQKSQVINLCNVNNVFLVGEWSDDEVFVFVEKKDVFYFYIIINYIYVTHHFSV